jgi:malonate transporter MadL subunit
MGITLGQLIGKAMGIEANVGGVGIAMLLLIVMANTSKRYIRIDPTTSQGIYFWNAMYIPIVVAMAAKQNVFAAIEGGPVALVAGTLAVVISFLLVPVISRWGGSPASSAASNTVSEKTGTAQ